MNVYDPSASQELVDKPVTTYLLFSDIGIKIFVEKLWYFYLYRFIWLLERITQMNRT